MFAAIRDQLRRAKGAFSPGRASRPGQLDEIDLETLLKRPAINLDSPELQRFLAHKRVMVTGAGGSIGSEICRQIMKFCPARLALVEQAENALFEIDRELRQRWMGMTIVPYVADITDATRIGNVFTAEKPQVIFHCAAHKHVPMMELNPGEAIKNNVFGTKTLADAAVCHGVSAFVMVSTDKAVNPTSVMGATKRVAEMYVQSLNEARRHEGMKARSGDKAEELSVDATRSTASLSASSTTSCLRASVPSCLSSTRFVAVRFGNVLGSSGSVVPIFRKQIEAGGPVTVTHPDMTRYFMTIPEASQLVLQAGAIAQGGEVFVLDMGQPVRILDLARDMIRLAGLKEGRDIDIAFTGVRPGEKLYEELSMTDEQTRPTAHDKIRVWQLTPTHAREIQRVLDLLADVIDAPREQAIFALRQSVPEYTPSTPASAPRDQATNLRLLVEQSTARAA